VNGLLLKKETMSVDISDWSSFSSAGDFDYVLFRTLENKVGVFEAFHPDRVSEFYEVKEDLAAGSFDGDTGVFVLVAKSGRVTVIPHPPLDAVFGPT
jgi:hypothetical protein